MKGGQYMPIKDFITTVLNIEENDIESIKTINNSGKSFDIFLTLKSYRPSCIYCGGSTKSKGFSKSSLSACLTFLPYNAPCIGPEEDTSVMIVTRVLLNTISLLLKDYLLHIVYLERL